MFYFTCNKSKIYECFTFWNNLQEKIYFFTTFQFIEIHLYVYVYVYVCVCIYIYIYRQYMHTLLFIYHLCVCYPLFMQIWI